MSPEQHRRLRLQSVMLTSLLVHFAAAIAEKRRSSRASVRRRRT